MENFFDRLGNIIRSYIDDDTIFTSSNSARHGDQTSDPDYANAYDELNDFLNGSDSAASHRSGWEEKPSSHATNQSRRTAGQTVQRDHTPKPRIPAELAPDFQILDVAFGAPLDTCKTSYKELLKKHHPDRHASDPVALKKATALSAKINTSFQRIEYWYTHKKMPL